MILFLIIIEYRKNLPSKINYNPNASDFKNLIEIQEKYFKNDQKHCCFLRLKVVKVLASFLVILSLLDII